MKNKTFQSVLKFSFQKSLVSHPNEFAQRVLLTHYRNILLKYFPSET